MGRGSGLGTQQVPGGLSGQGKPGHGSPLILCPPSGSQFPPSGVGSLPVPQLPLRGTSHFLSPLLLPIHSPHTPCPTQLLGVPPIPLGVCGLPPVPGRCPSCEETRIPRLDSMPSCPVFHLFLNISSFFFFLIFFFYSYFIYLFIYFFNYFWLCWVLGSCEGFLQLRQAGATPHCGAGTALHHGARAPHYRGPSRCGAQAPDAQAQQPWHTGPAAPRHVGSSQTRARTRVPCTSRQTLNHCATREAQHFFILLNVLLKVFCLYHNLFNLSPYCYTFSLFQNFWYYKIWKNIFIDKSLNISLIISFG